MRRFARTAGVWAWGTIKALYRRSIYALAFVGFVLLCWTLITTAFYAVTPGSFFLNYYRIELTPAIAGDDVPMTVCRSRHYGDIKAHITRSFYKARDTTSTKLVFDTIGGYEEDITIEDGPDCQNLKITAQRFEHTAGMWKFHTDVVFYVEGRRKTTSYDSPVYAILERPTNAELKARFEEQLRDLQRRINELGQQVSYVPPAAAGSSPSTARSQDVTTSAPPEPPQAAQRSVAPATGGGTPQHTQTATQPLVVLSSPLDLLNAIGGDR